MTTRWTLLSLIIFHSSCSLKKVPDDPIPKHESMEIQSEILQEKRILNIYLPAQYQNSDEAFPILYMLDGGINEDFPHIANTLAKLITEKKIKPIILVGIENTDRRRDLSGFSEVKEDEKYCPLSDGAKEFRAFINTELKPNIERRYRHNGYEGIIGESLAGLFIMESFFLNPNSYDFYIAMDPSLWWNDHYLEKQASHYLETMTKLNAKLWFAASSAESISIHAQSLAKTLENKALPGLTWKYSDEAQEEHHSIFRASKEKALIWALSN